MIKQFEALINNMCTKESKCKEAIQTLFGPNLKRKEVKAITTYLLVVFNPYFREVRK